MVKFQFLLGTLKTHSSFTHPQKEEGFQFLLGTLKTLGATFYPYIDFEFQFLLGTLKTCANGLRMLNAGRFNSF